MAKKLFLLGVVALFIGVLTLSTGVFAQIHKWKDANGVTQYGDRPPVGVVQKESSRLQSGSMNQSAGGCGNIPLTAQEINTLARLESDFWRRISPTDLTALKRHPQWNHFLSTAEAMKLWRKYELSARGDYAQRFFKEKRSQPQTAWRNNPADVNTANSLRAAEACKDKYDNDVVPKMVRRLDGTPFEKYFIPPSASHFEPPVEAPSPDVER